MRTLSFLLFTFLCIQAAAGFSVILKSGKTVEGARIGEDQFSIQLKDKSGVVLSFKKSMLDLDAMAALNVSPEPPAKQTVIAREPPKTLVQIAEETRKSRSGSAHVLTYQDLAQAPEVTVLGSGRSPSTSVELQQSSLPSKEERYWREIAVELRRDVSTLQEKRISVEASCERAKERQAEKRTTPHRQTVDFFSLYQDPPECKKLREVDRQLQEVQSRMEDFEERARRSGVPWQWLE